MSKDKQGLRKFALAMAAAAALSSPAFAAGSSTTTTVTTTDSAVPGTVSRTEWETTRQAMIPAGARLIYPQDFDINRDNVLTRAETGRHLFRIYDGDGNGVLDNIEFERRAVMALAPVKTDTVIRYDLNGDGITDQSQVTSQVFFERTMLSRFDKDDNGISPREFTGRAFNIADINNDRSVDLAEWEASYNAALDARLKRDAALNK